jgi:hypothetical protein
MDSLNALILLNRQEPSVLAERPVSIDVLDLDDAGPAFGKASLAALSQPGGRLHGCRITFRHIHYDWIHAEQLINLLAEGQTDNPITICSSEGGLFEYGSDTEIESNLKALCKLQIVAVVGSVTRADEPVQFLRKASTPKTRPRGLTVFAALANSAGWKVARAIERPFSDQVVLHDEHPNPLNADGLLSVACLAECWIASRMENVRADQISQHAAHPDIRPEVVAAG